MIRSRAARIACFACVSLLAACSSGPSGPAEQSSWDIIQHDVLATNCVSCHSSGTSFSRQSDLVLTSDVAYEQLLNVAPTNPEAAAASLVRVSDQGLSGLLRSYLWEKINAPDIEHFYADHPGYGEIMPLGQPPLTNGELEFIRRWIVAGAPETGAVVDVALLDDGERFDLPAFEALERPSDGIQLHLEPFEVRANFEREVFRYMPLDNSEDVFVNSFELSMRPGSHHFILYTYPDYTPAEDMPAPYELRDLRDPVTGKFEDSSGRDVFNWRNMLYAKPIVISQSRRLDFHLPQGVAMRLPPGSGIDVNAHYANESDATIEGEAFVNLGLLEADKVEHEARVFAMSNFDIHLPAGQVTTLEREFFFTENRRIIQLVSHTHDRMLDFNAEIIGGDRDGELVYVTYDWEHPAPLRFDPPLEVHEGQGLRIRATYDNYTDGDLYFGFTRKEAEMMILYGYYYTD